MFNVVIVLERKPIHIKAKPEDIAKNVIAVGDPGRVEILMELLDDAKIVNKHRGFIIATGFYKDTRVSIATHGVGGPSAAIVFEELVMLGAKNIVRLGTAGGLVKELDIGSIYVATGAGGIVNGGGLSLYAPNYIPAASPDPWLTVGIMDSLERNRIKYYYGPVFSSDSFYAETPGLAEKLSSLGFKAIEMECLTLFTLGWMRGFRTAAVLVISDNLVAEEFVFLTTMELKDKFIAVAKAILETFSKLNK